MTAIGSLMVANRGEIACRIMRTASAMGIRTIAVHSEADSGAPHVRQADEAVLIGPAPAAESYLNIERIIAAANSAGADAIHPGYGFLSENAAFAEACAAAGLIFVGPPVEAIALMGNKAEAKRRMFKAGVPCVPGYEGRDQSDKAFAAAANEIGFPVMVKAAAGGGGRGMRLVEDNADLLQALKLARSEAESAFGSGELILEKAIIVPRHVEIQVFADSHGNIVHLGERDCSVQRRHQKVIEEAPSPAVDIVLRERMGAAAVEAARSIGYVGAGTVEFLLDAAGEYYFLEMNTRLQVEHPVTEMITGLDLVAMQIAVARGEPLGFEQEDLLLTGHAIEVRLYAEDPSRDFLPSTGQIALWRPPDGAGVRTDAGIESGQAVSPFYDPMLAKIVAWGEDRDTARRRLIDALGRAILFGPATNRDFLIAALENENFAVGEATTAFIGEEFSAGGVPTGPDFEEAAIAALLRFLWVRNRALSSTGRVSPELLNWSNRGPLTFRFRMGCEDDGFELAVMPDGDAYRISNGDKAVSLSVQSLWPDSARLRIGSKTVEVAWLADDAGVWLATPRHIRRFRSIGAGAANAETGTGGGRIVAPMHGRVTQLVVSTGEEVAEGARLAVLEAMKMQHQIASPLAGKVTAVHVAAGSQVAAGDLLIEIDEAL